MPGALQKILGGIVRYQESGLKSLLVEQMRRQDDLKAKSQAVFVTCMDSRLMPKRITQTDQTSALFVIRNAGNMIPPLRIDPSTGLLLLSTEPAAMELATVGVGIDDVIICGHSDCKAMKCLHQEHDRMKQVYDKPFVNDSLFSMCLRQFGAPTLYKFQEYLKDPKRPLQFNRNSPYSRVYGFEALVDADDELDVVDKLSEIHCLQQLENCMSYGDFLAKNQNIRLHAMWYCVSTGYMYYFRRDKKSFQPLTAELADEILREHNLVDLSDTDETAPAS